MTIRSPAQIDIDAISTDTINLLNQQQQITDKKMKTMPLWSTLIFPGLGHQSIGRMKSALGYVSTDLLSLFGTIFFYQLSKKTTHNSHAFASLYAGVATSIKDDYYWEIIGNFNKYEDFNETMGQVRFIDYRYQEERYRWVWEDPSLREEFVSMQKTAKRLNTVSSFFIGAMILNRVIAFIDLRSALKNYRYDSNTTVSLRPFIIGTSSNGLVLITDF